MDADQEAAYWDYVAKDSVRIEAEVYGDLRRSDCYDAIAPHLKMEGFIFDLGCGVGRLTHMFADMYPEVQFVGMDSSPLMIDTARLMAETANVHFVENNGRDLTVLAGRLYEGGFSMTMFQHIPHEAQQEYLHEIRRVLHRGGRFRLQFVFEGEAGPLSFPTPVNDMLRWCDDAGLRETDIGLGLIKREWCWLTLVKA